MSRVPVPVERPCVVCPGTSLKVTYRGAYDRAEDESQFAEQQRDIEIKLAEKKKQYDEEMAEYLALSPKMQKRNFQPSPPFLEYGPRYRSPYRRALDPEWDVEHLLHECLTCGYRWNKIIVWDEPVDM